MSAPPPGPQLQPPGPAQNDWLIHFCGRPSGAGVNRAAPADIVQATPAQRLDRILWEGFLRGFPPFGAAADQPMICLTESPLDHLRWLLTERGWPPWGLMFTRQQVYDLDGGPVWYARNEQYAQLPLSVLPWAVRFDTTPGSRSEWLHEREWRIPIPPDAPGLCVNYIRPVLILIGDRGWQPSVRMEEREFDMTTGVASEDLPHPPHSPMTQQVRTWPLLWFHVPRVWWNADAGTFEQA